MSKEFVNKKLAKLDIEVQNARATKAEWAKIVPTMNRIETLNPIEQDFLISRDDKEKAGFNPDIVEPEADEEIEDVDEYRAQNTMTFDDFKDNLTNVATGEISPIYLGQTINEYRRLGLIDATKLRELQPLILQGGRGGNYDPVINKLVELYNNVVEAKVARLMTQNKSKLTRYKQRLGNTYLGKFNTQQLPNETDEEFYYRIQSYKDQLPDADSAIRDEINSNIKSLKEKLSKFLRPDEIELIINDKNIVNDATLLFLNSTWKAFYNYVKTNYTSIKVNEFKILLQEYATDRVLPSLTLKKVKPADLPVADNLPDVLPVAEPFIIEPSPFPSRQVSRQVSRGKKSGYEKKSGYKYVPEKIKLYSPPKWWEEAEAAYEEEQEQGGVAEGKAQEPDEEEGFGANFEAEPNVDETKAQMKKDITKYDKQLRKMEKKQDKASLRAVKETAKEQKRLEKEAAKEVAKAEKALAKAEKAEQKRLEGNYRREQAAAPEPLVAFGNENRLEDIVEELKALPNADLVSGMTSAYNYFKANDIEPEATKEFTRLLRNVKSDNSIKRQGKQNILIAAFAPILKSARDSYGATNVKRMAGLGIKANTKEEYLPFGRVLISLDKLQMNKIKLIYANTGSNHPKFRKQIKISNVFKELLMEILEHQKFNHRLFKMLDATEASICLDLLKSVGLKKTLKITDLENNADKEIMNEYEIICGEIESGNDNPQLVKRAKQLIAGMIKMNKISRQTGLEMLLCL